MTKKRSTKKYKGKSPEEKRAEVKALFGDLKAGVANLVDSTEWARWLTFKSHFHNYSFNNVMLITLQCPGATHVAGFQAWKKMKRQVRKGEKGLRILAPSGVARFKKEVTTASGEVKEKEFSFMRFRAVSVFDVSQTDGDELPEAPGANKLMGGDRGLSEALQSFSESENDCPVALKPNVVHGANGAYFPLEHRIEVDSNMSPAQQAKTLAHEIGHSLLHRGMKAATLSRDDKELEAESIAYIVCNHFGLETADYSFGYLAHWKGKGAEDGFRESAERICNTSKKVIEWVSKVWIDANVDSNISEAA